LEAAVRLIPIPLTDKRHNVAGHPVRTVTIGATASSEGELLLSSFTRQWPAFSRWLVGSLRSLLGLEEDFTSVQLNSGYSADLHTDKGNLGMSVVTSFGEFRGGCLWYYHPHGATYVEVRHTNRDADLAPCRGSWLPGKVQDARHSAVRIDGRLPHIGRTFLGRALLGSVIQSG
jgi:hypothetical protein